VQYGIQCRSGGTLIHDDFHLRCVSYLGRDLDGRCKLTREEERMKRIDANDRRKRRSEITFTDRVLTHEL